MEGVDSDQSQITWSGIQMGLSHGIQMGLITCKTSCAQTAEDIDNAQMWRQTDNSNIRPNCFSSDVT